MLGMAILPCSDAYYRCATNNVSDSVNVLEHNHKTEHKDFCSPFVAANVAVQLMELHWILGYLKSMNLSFSPLIKEKSL